ncbi:T9SS type A sorting domain-containing protein [Fibrisoma limi]|nr:T9SS type A sorting domain-containing protein [Fibrisoma limi]
MNPLPNGGGGANSANFSDWQTITFILNKEGNALKYLTPAGALEQQPIDTYDLWVGTTKVFDNQPVLMSTQPMTDFRITFEDGISKVQFDDFLFRNISGTLPVELVSFTAKPAGKHVQLAWSTTSEREADRFVVERSGDLKEYTRVGEVVAKGTTDQRQYYGLTDESPMIGNNYYRLKQVDTDGSIHYSKIVAAVMDDETPSFELRGNPAERNTIQLVSRNLINATYHLTTLTGQELAVRAETQADQSLLLIPAQGLAPGVYLLRAQQGATRLVRKIVVQ